MHTHSKTDSRHRPVHKLGLLLLCSLLFTGLNACQEDPVINSGQDFTQPTSASSVNPTASSNNSSTPDSSAAPQDSSGDTGVRLTGVVKDKASGLLLSEALIRIDTTSTITDGAGYYQMDHLVSGEAILIVQHPGYVPYTAQINLSSGRSFQDIALEPLTGNNQSSSPSASPTPVILKEDGTVSQPSASASPSPSSSASNSPEPTPSPSSGYDPQLDEVVQTKVVARRQENGLALVFLLQRSNGLPVNWEWGTVKIEYYLANKTVPSEGSTLFLTSGTSILTANGDTFVVDTGDRNVENQIEINFTLTFPNGRQLPQDLTLNLNAS